LDKTLIETPTIELLEFFDKVSKEADKEKGPANILNKTHFWWTRKPLVVARAMALVSTLNDLDAANYLLGINKKNRAYQNFPDEKYYEKVLGRKPSSIKVLDPFAGQGNLIFEAMRLGLQCYSSDYNPVAYLIEKGVLEYPNKNGIRMIEDFEKYAQEAIDLSKKELEGFYPTQQLVYFWAWCIKCPHCGQRFPLLNNMYLEKNEKTKVGLKFTLTQNKNFKIEIIKNISDSE